MDLPKTGMVEIVANNRQANSSLIAGYGYTGILVSFIARHHPLAIMPVAILFGGLSAAAGRISFTAAGIVSFPSFLLRIAIIAATFTTLGRASFVDRATLGVTFGD